jgi:dihydrofolate reductase
MSAPLVLVVAVADNGVIGDRGGIPWRIPEDKRRFKALTLGKPLVMGRRTWESLPRRPLAGRTNIVITRDTAYRAEGALLVHTFEAALARADAEAPHEICIAGGVEVYAAALPLVARIELTEVHMDVAGDTVMPTFDRSAWRETLREERATASGLRYSFVTLERGAGT